MRCLLFLQLWLLSTTAAFSLWKGDGQNHQRISSWTSSSLSSSSMGRSNSMESFEFNDRLRKAYDEWSETYGDTIDESRMEIFSYHFVMAENYFKETGNRIKLNEYADLTAVEFQRLKEMGGMVQDSDDSNSPHWAPEDVAQMDFFAKQTSQRQQAFQDSNKNNKGPDLPKPPPGYFSVLTPPTDGENPQPETAASHRGRESYQQRFTQSYLETLNSKAMESEHVSSLQQQNIQDPSLQQNQEEQVQESDMYMFNGDHNGNNIQQLEVPAAANQQQQQAQSFQPEPAEKPELQDLINSRYGGIGFLEDSAMVGNGGSLDYKFFPALSKMYNLDYPEQAREQRREPPPPQMERPPPQMDRPPPQMDRPPPQMDRPPPQPQEFIQPPPPNNDSEQERRETFMNAMSLLYAQMFGDDARPPDREAFEMMEQMVMNNERRPPPPMGYDGPPPQGYGVTPRGGQWGTSSEDQGGWSTPRPNEKRPVDPMQQQQQEEEEPVPPEPEEEEAVGTEILLGELSYTMTRGRVIEWLKNIGDPVQQGEPLCVVESDTYTMVDGQKYAETHDVVALEDGILAAVYADAAETVPVGSILGVVAADMEEASRVPQTMDQERLDFVDAHGKKEADEEVLFDKNGYPVDEEGYLLDSVPVDEDGYPIGEYVNGYPVDEDGYIIEDEYGVDEEGYPVDDGYDENGYPIDEYGAEEGGGGSFDDRGTHGEGFGEESAYTGPVDDDPDLPSWVLGNAPSIAPAKVASKYPVVPKMDRPQPAATPKPKKVSAARRPVPKRTPPKGRAQARGSGRRDDTRARKPPGRVDDVQSPATKKGAPPKPKIEGTEINLSELAYGMTKGTVIEWIKNVGDQVSKGEPLAVVESDTFMMIDGQKYAESHDVVASQDGVLAAIYTGVKQTMPVGSLLGVIADNEAAARNVPQTNPYENSSNDADEAEDTKPLSRTQRAAAAAAQASADPVNRVRASPLDGFLDSVEQVEEDALQMNMEQQNQQADDEFNRRFMTPEELESADFAAASGGFNDSGGPPAATPNDDRDLPSWVLGNAPSIAPAKVASKYPVVPKISQPAVNSPSMNAINAARNAAMQNENASTNTPPPPSRSSSASPQRNPAPHQRRAPPPKRRSAPPKRREASGRGRIDNIRAPLNQPQEDKGVDIVLSELSYGMKKGMIIEWLKNVGDPVKKGEPIAVVESDTFMVIDTQKYAESHDILASQDGFLAAQYGGPKELFEVGAVLGVIAETASAARNFRSSSSSPRGSTRSNGASASSSHYPQESNEPGEAYFPPPEPGTESDKAAWADDPDLPSWVLGNAPSIAPAKVASKYPVVPNMRRSSSTPTPAASQAPTSGVVNGSTGTQRRIPKGRYDDTRARPKQIRVEDKTQRARPRGRIDDIRAPLAQHSSGGRGTEQYNSGPEPRIFPDLTKANGSNERTHSRFSNTANEEPPETEEPQYMPDLSGSARKSKPPRKRMQGKSPENVQPDPVAEDDTNADVPTADEDQPEFASEDATTAETGDEFGDVPQEVVAEEAAGTNGELLSEEVQDNVEDVPNETSNEFAENTPEGSVSVDTEEAQDSVEDVPQEVMADEAVATNGEQMSEEVQASFETEEHTHLDMQSEEGTPADLSESLEDAQHLNGFEHLESDTNVTDRVETERQAKTNSQTPKNASPTAKTNSTETMVQEILVTAKARTAAEDAKIDLTAIQGTGEAGCITLDDVKLAIARKKPKIGIRFLTDKPKTRNSSSKEKSKEGP
eukprot:scaffold2533_cov137-Cylindrotheca_fusiformis.AAC.7